MTTPTPTRGPWPITVDEQRIRSWGVQEEPLTHREPGIDAEEFGRMDALACRALIAIVLAGALGWFVWERFM